MPLSILYNSASQLAMASINKETSDACKTLKKAATGQKITSAQDDAAGYAVSEKMNTQIRSLGQDKQNTQNGAALLKIASGSVENIVESLRQLKELAINAATDTNTDDDRAILQKTADQILEHINDVATTTHYNGKALIDGTYGKITQTTAGDVTINGDGVYEIADGFSGTIVLGESAKNVKLTTSAGSLSNVQIVGAASGGANIWLENLNITNTEDMSVIKMQGSGNTLTVSGTNNLSITATNATSAVINVGGGTTIQGDDLTKDFYTGSITSTLNVISVGNGTGAGIGSDANGVGGSISVGTGFNLNVTYAGTGAAIGSGVSGSIGNISTAYLATVTVNSTNGRILGAGNSGLAGNISIAHGQFDSTYMGSLEITDLVKGSSAHISNGSGGSYTLVYNGSGADLMNNAGLTSDLGYEVGDDVNNTTVSEPSGTADSTSNSSSSGGTSGGSTTVIQNEPLKIHTGTKSGQYISVYLNDMHTRSMKGKVPNESDVEYLATLQNDMDKYNAYAELLAKVQTLTLDNLNLRTRYDSNVAIRLVDSALDYALDQATNIGAYMQRLEHTENNITTEEENTQAAESTIRDADMAKVMTAYTKTNVLAQAAQSVLAQANQNSGRVLELLQ